MYYSPCIAKIRPLCKTIHEKDAPGNKEPCNSEEVHYQNMQKITVSDNKNNITLNICLCQLERRERNFET
jgi:hypothetical protein